MLRTAWVLASRPAQIAEQKELDNLKGFQQWKQIHSEMDTVPDNRVTEGAKHRFSLHLGVH